MDTTHDPRETWTDQEWNKYYQALAEKDEAEEEKMQNLKDSKL